MAQDISADELIASINKTLNEQKEMIDQYKQSTKELQDKYNRLKRLADHLWWIQCFVCSMDFRLEELEPLHGVNALFICQQCIKDKRR